MDFDNTQMSEQDARALGEAVQKIVAQATGIEDTFVYANSSQIKIKVAPVELFIQLSKKYIPDQAKLVNQIKQGLTDWKKTSGFKYPINLSFIPMEWQIEVGI